MNVLRFIEQSPRRVLALLALGCVAGLGFALYLQHQVGLEPCPMCIVQREVLILVGVVSALSAALARQRRGVRVGSALVAVLAALGAFVAARQSWLQWYPPEVTTCGRDLYGMIETFPLQRVIPMVFKGSGDCSVVDWTFLGGSLANWSFVVFCGVMVLSGVLFARASNPTHPAQ